MTTPVSAPISNDAQMPFIVQPKPMVYPTASAHGPATIVSLSSDAQAQLKSKEIHSSQVGDGR